MFSKGPAEVSRRRVFYIPGYDPHPPRRYREQYRRERGKQGAISGYRVDLKHDKSGTGWTARGLMDGADVRSKIDVLVWHDLVQGSMRAGLIGTYAALVRTVWVYLSTGTFRRLSWLAKGPVLAALYPVIMLLGQLFAALAGAVTVAGVAGVLTIRGGELLNEQVFGTTPNTGSFVWSLVGAAVFWAVFMAVLLAALRWFKSKDDVTFAHYLMHDYAYTASKRGDYPREIEARLHDWRHRVEADLRDDIVEVLIVGHSSGAQLAVSLLADILKRGRLPDDGPVLSLLTLGQVIPMVSFLPEAQRLRSDLRQLSISDEITWVDVSAPGDGCCFALSDPVSVSGVAPETGQQWPLILSAAFSNTLSPETLKTLKHRYFRLHFQYLCAFDKPGDYDYFRITAGPQTLGQRFRGRRTSPSRIDVPASRFTSTFR